MANLISTTIQAVGKVITSMIIAITDTVAFFAIGTMLLTSIFM